MPSVSGRRTRNRHTRAHSGRSNGLLLCWRSGQTIHECRNTLALSWVGCVSAVLQTLELCCEEEVGEEGQRPGLTQEKMCLAPLQHRLQRLQHCWSRAL